VIELYSIFGNYFEFIGNEVVFQCRDEGQLRAQVRWVRGNGLPLPPGSRDYNGRLEMPSIAVEHTGEILRFWGSHTGEFLVFG